MADILSSAPVLSTPDNHILSEIEPAITPQSSQRLSDDQLSVRYEIDRTIKEIRHNRWRRIALQFPDHMLPDSARVFQLLARELKAETSRAASISPADQNLEEQIQDLKMSSEEQWPVKLTILGDTSYGSCCVDEIAAEHVDADVVVHYGRSCLSQTARLPVIYVFTEAKLDHEACIKAFATLFPEKDTKVIITADTSCTAHVKTITAQLQDQGYRHLFAAEMIHDPSSPIPNRSVPGGEDESTTSLNEWELYHIADPPTSLLLTLSSRMKSVYIYSISTNISDNVVPQLANTSMILRRRYALITSMSTVSTWGILINTLSVKNYLHIVDHVKRRISEAGKKSYLFVVGKLNAAKVANFSEIGGWVVIGCWESSLIDSKDLYKPIITPFELDLVLAGDENRVWTGEWRSDFQGVLDNAQPIEPVKSSGVDEEQNDNEEGPRDYDSEEESAPPEFDLRTGRYVSHTRPMAVNQSNRETNSINSGAPSSTALMKRAGTDILAVNGISSPAAEFLAQKRTWRGLGSDFEIRYDEDEVQQGSAIEEGRTGVASGYSRGDSAKM